MGAKKRLALLGIFSTTALGALALAACSDDNNGTTVQTPDAGGDTSTNTGDTGASGDTVKIGVTIGLTGAISGIAAGIQNAVKVSQDVINTAGGVTGKNVEFIIEDDASNDGPELTAAMTKFLTKDKVAAILGPLGSGQVKKAYPLAKQAKIIELSPSATSADLSVGDVFGGSDRYFFRTVPPDNFQAKAVAKFAYDGPPDVPGPDGGSAGCKRMAIVNIDAAYGTSLAPDIAAAFKAKGGEVVYTKTVPTDDKVFTSDSATAVVNEMKAVAGGPPDCQVVVMYEIIAGTYLKALAAQRGSFPSRFFTVGTDGIYTQKFLDVSRTTATDPTSVNVANNVYGTNPDTNPTGRPQFDFFRTRYTTKFPLPAGTTDLPSYTANAFDAVLLEALAIQAAGGTSDPVKVRDALKAVANPPGTKYGPQDFVKALADAKAGLDIDYQGASGDVDLRDPEGYADSNYIVWKATQATGQAPTYSTLLRIPTGDL